MSKTVFSDGVPPVKGTRVTAEFLNWLQDQLVPVGSVFYFAASIPPLGFLECNGSNTVSRTTYAALYAVVGTTYGAGVDGNSFMLPDLRGEFIRGWDHNRNVDAPSGVSRVIGTLQADDLKAHNHTINSLYSGGNENELPSILAIGQAGATEHLDLNVTTTGGTETRPRNVALLACIKY